MCKKIDHKIAFDENGNFGVILQFIHNLETNEYDESPILTSFQDLQIEICETEFDRDYEPARQTALDAVRKTIQEKNPMDYTAHQSPC